MSNEWEYLVIGVQNNTVMSVNGQQCCFMPEGRGAQRYFELHEYLPMIGADGWEVVAASPSQTGDAGKLTTWTLIVKRAKG